MNLDEIDAGLFEFIYGLFSLSRIGDSPAVWKVRRRSMRLRAMPIVEPPLRLEAAVAIFGLR